jgi:hypothetical protein
MIADVDPLAVGVQRGAVFREPVDVPAPRLCRSSSAVASSRGYWLAGHTADEHVEVVVDLEFFEQCVQQSTRQRETAPAPSASPRRSSMRPCRRQ